MFHNVVQEKNALLARANNAASKLLQHHYISNNHKKFYNDELHLIKTEIYRLGHFNLNEIRQKVVRFEMFCSRVEKATYKLREEVDSYVEFQRGLSQRIDLTLGTFDDAKRRGIQSTFYQRVNNVINLLNSQVEVIVKDPSAYPVKKSYEKLLVIDSDFRQELQKLQQQIKQDKQEALRQEKEKAATAARALNQQQITAAQNNFNKQVQQLQNELESKAEQLAQEKSAAFLSLEKPRMMDLWRQEFVDQEKYMIEEEVSKRLKIQIENTLKMRDETHEEKIELTTLKFSRSIEKISSVRLGYDFFRYSSHQKFFDSQYFIS